MRHATNDEIKSMNSVEADTMSKAEERLAAPSEQEPSASKDVHGLIVFVHGLHPLFRGKASYGGMEHLLKAQLPNHDFYGFHYLGTYWSSSDPEKLARRIEEQIRKKTAENNYQQIYLFGHSFGALLLRQAILYGAELDGQKDDWLSKVKRVVLLAGANRGFQPYTGWLEVIASFGSLLQRLPLIPAPLRLGRLAVYGLRGSVWVTKLRMQWVKMSVDKPEKLPFTVQIRGTTVSSTP